MNKREVGHDLLERVYNRLLSIRAEVHPALGPTWDAREAVAGVLYKRFGRVLTAENPVSEQEVVNETQVDSGI